MSTIIINGNKISVSGEKSIIVSNGKVLVDGIDVTPDSKEINITVDGNIEKLEVDACNKLLVTGDVDNIKTLSGSVDVTGNVNGSVQTMSGSVDCGNIAGSVSTMSGNVKHKK